MPLYEYKCDNCGEVFEAMQKFSDPPLATHERCGGAVHRLLSAPALQFKGSGWYITDYARGGATSSANGSDAKSETPAAAKSDTGGSPSSKTESTASSAPATADKSSS
jgi:putative FmdB family regulatory protein